MGVLRVGFIAVLVVAAFQLRRKLQEVLQLKVQDGIGKRELTAYAGRLETEVQQRRGSEKELNAYVAQLEQTGQALRREVAERTKNEEALSRQALTILESEVRLRAIFNNASTASSRSTTGVTSVPNPAAEHLFGIKAEEIRHRRINELLPDIRLEDAAPSMVCELSGRRSDGGKFPASLSVERTESGRENLFVCLVRDNTAEQVSRQALVEARDAAERPTGPSPSSCRA